MAGVPKKLQGVLWSCEVDKLDLERDAAYIVNQILSYGTMQEIEWLFKTYGRERVREIFVHQPIKTYTPAGFYLMKKLVLGVPDEQAPAYRYDRTVPRRLG